MNILVDNNSSLIKYQGGTYELQIDNIRQYDNGILLRVICDLNMNIAIVYDVEEIPDFIGNKYLYTNGIVEINPDFVGA